MSVSLLDGHRPRWEFSDERVPINIAPEVRARLNAVLYSDYFMGTGVGFSAFINRACEAAETEIAERAARDRERRQDYRIPESELRDGFGGIA